MTAFGVNTEPFPVTRLVARPYGVISGVNVAVATLPQSNYLRYLKRLILDTGLTPASTGTPAKWDYNNQEVIFRLTLGTPDSGTCLDRTNFGVFNINDYEHSVPIPPHTDINLCWYDVLPAAATLCVATMVLDERP